MEILSIAEKNALRHYNNNIEYYNEDTHINASMTGQGLVEIFKKLNIKISDSSYILDFGCGTGGTTKFMFEKICTSVKPNVVAIDYSETRLNHASYITQPWISNIEYIQADVNIWLKENKGLTFDIILAFEIIEHLEDSCGVVDELKSHLSKGGVLICTLPYQEQPNDIHLSAFKDERDVKVKLGLTLLDGIDEHMRFPNQKVFYYEYE